MSDSNETNPKQLFLERESGSSNNNEVDYDTIDYSTAFQREDRRRQASQELLKLNADVLKRSQEVKTDFVDEIMCHEGVSNNDVVFDVLPSFEMYRSLQYTSRDNGNEVPPEYFNNPNMQPSIDEVSSPVYEPRPSIGDSTIPSSLSIMGSSVTAASSQTEDADVFGALDYDPFDKNMLDNLNKLPRLKTPELKVDVHVTKDVPTPYSKCESESMLKEYTSGDVVHGYLTITNNSKKEIPFHMFTVTLEGTTSIIDVKGKKQMLKTFLNMMDLSASWSHGCISPSANITYKHGSSDYDGSYLGLPADRILQPMTTYKKFFTFKFPYNTLDTTCRHQQELHTLLPPSFGINRIKGRGKYSHIDINPVLGYGHTGKRGSPIVTRDLSNNQLSVNYSINATLIGFDPCDSNNKNLICLSEDEFALRFIPFGFGVSLFSSERALTTLKKLIEHTFNTAERSLKLKLEGNEEEVQALDRQLKLAQLRLNPNSGASDQPYANFPLRNQHHASPDFSKVETGLVYANDVKTSGFLSKLKAGNDSNCNGFISITTELPKDGLPYISPALVKKTNEISKLNRLGIANWNLMDSTLSANEKKKLTAMNINLKFTPSDNRKPNDPLELPKIKHVDAKLLVLNIYSHSSIPIKLSSDIFFDKNDLFKKLKADFAKYDAQYEALSEKYKTYGLKVENFIPGEISQDIKAMKSLQNDTFTLNVFDHDLEGPTTWEKSANSNEWTQSLQLNLEFKDRIQETLIPTFQSCLLSRMYCIQVDVTFKKGQTASLRVPIRLRQFDGN